MVTDRKLHVFELLISTSSLSLSLFYQYSVAMWSGFIGVEVAHCPLVPKFTGSHPDKAVGFLGRKNPQHTFLRKGSKAIGLVS